MRVSGIKTDIFNNIKDYITVDGTGSQTQTEAAATSSAQTQTQAQAQSAPVSSYVAPPVPEVFADAGDSRTVIVGADARFDGRAYNRQKEILEHVRFLWNFGDGATAEGPAVLHHFGYPGRYAVVLTIAEDRSASVDQITVLAEPANLSFFAISDGSVRIENRAGRDLDLSRWIVRQSGRDFPLPEHSVILAGSSMFITQKTLGFWSNSSAELDYPNGILAFRAGESSGNAGAIPAPATAAPVPVVTAPAPKAPSVPAATKAAAPQNEPGEVLGAGTSAPPPERGGTSSALWLSLAALAGLLASAAAGVWYLERRTSGETSLMAGGFEIEE